MSTITVLPHKELCPEGTVIHDADPERSVCEILLDHGIPLEHACEMSCACTTCHVIVKEGFNSLDDATDEEEDMLDKAWGLKPTSRLSCQAHIQDQDLVIEIPKYTINHAKENH